MQMKRLAISGMLAGALVGLPLTAARADNPTTADQAEVAAQKARDRADHYRELGGAGYKAGLVQRADADATRYDAMAQELAPTAAYTDRAAAAERDAKVDAHLQMLGGVVYKAGVDEQARAAHAQEQGGGVAQTPNPSCQRTKPSVDFACKP